MAVALTVTPEERAQIEQTVCSSVAEELRRAGIEVEGESERYVKH